MSPLEKALARATAHHPRKIDLSLGRIEAVLKTLGNPHLNLPPTVHVAGTNGKGSTIALLRAMAEAQGLSVHVYTSPHLVHFNERIVLASQPISDALLTDYLDQVFEASQVHPLTFFEATTVAAFLAFSQNPADLLILEVGLGGRLDATNVIETPAACAITPIDYDHAEFLGRDIAKIAREKAGIIKFHSAVFTGPQHEAVNAVLDAEANRRSTKLSQFGQDFQSYRQHGRMVFQDADQLMDLPQPSLLGEHQISNAGLAIAVAKHLQISETAIAQGLETASWPARMQRLTTGPLFDMADDAGAELWLDGGHNPHAARAIAAVMADREMAHARPLILITGMLASKDCSGFLDAFSGLAHTIIALDIDGHASLAPETITELAQLRGIEGQIANNLIDAVQRAINTGLAISGGTAPRVLICGSLYLAGQVLEMNTR